MGSESESGTGDRENEASPAARDLPRPISGLERLVAPGLDALRSAQERVEPAWQAVTGAEARWQVSIAILVAISLQVALPSRVGAHPRWLFPTVAGLGIAAIIIANPTRVDRHSVKLRGAVLLLTAVMSAANMNSAIRLVIDLINAEGLREPSTLLLTGAAIWLTNVIVFALWYWEFDRGGPAERAMALKRYPDFLFPQMTSPELAPPDWEPEFTDYLFMSFTNATAFSPTDVMPLSRWAKILMMLQSAISLMLAALVIARSVNILR